jgi:hypothetical protein
MKSPKTAQRQKTQEPQESIADFKQRIALLMRNREGGKVYSMIGAAPPDPCVIRPKHTELTND